MYISIRSKEGLTVNVDRLVLVKHNSVVLLNLYSSKGENIGFVDLNRSRFKFDCITEYSKSYILIPKDL